MTSVVVVDDQDLVRAGFGLILSTATPAITVIGEAGNGRDAVRLACELLPDVVVMDIRMPLMDGIQATREIIRAGCPSKVLILTTFDAEQHIYDAFRAGASGFLLKNAPSEQLIDAVHAVAAGDALLAPGITRRLIARFIEQPAPGSDAAVAVLTEREREVLILVAAGMSNQEIADRLHLSQGTVKTHVNRILTKLFLRDRVQAVVLAFETGLVRPGQRGS
jgi:DNA-binding NarL/FixJ family response regulator